MRLPAYAFEVRAQLTPEFEVTPPRIVDGPEPYVELVAEAKAFRPTKDLQFRFNARADRASVSEGIPSFGVCGCDVPGRARSNSTALLGFTLLGCTGLLARRRTARRPFSLAACRHLSTRT